MGRNLFILIALIVLIPILVMFGLPAYTKHNKHDKIKLSTLSESPLREWKLWEKKVKTDSLDVWTNYKYLCALSKVIKARQASDDYIAPSMDKVEESYYLKAKSGFTASASIGNFGLGYIALHNKKYKAAYEYLTAVQDTNMPVVNYLMGEAKRLDIKWAEAEKYYKKEIAKKGDLAEAYNELGNLYYREYKRRDFLKLADDAQARAYLPVIPAREFSFKSRRFLSYLRALFYGIYSYSDLVAFLIFMAICAIWIVYFRKIDIYEPEKWKHLFMVFCLGILIGIWALIIGDDERGFLKVHFGNELPDYFNLYVLNAFLEEGLKLIPLLLLMRFSRLLNEPLDFMIYAALVALGFSFATQAQYFTNIRLDIILIHGVLFPLLHMILSMLIAYGIVLGKFQRKMKLWLSFLMWFGISVVLHVAVIALFPYYQGLIVFAMAFPMVWFTGLIINNTMDQTGYYTEKIKYHPGVVMQFLLFSFTAIILFALLVRGLWLGSHFMVLTNVTVSVALGIPLLGVAGYFLSSFKIVPGYWAKLQYDDTVILPAFYSVTRGAKLRIRSFHADSVLNHLKTFTVSTIREIELDDLKGWLLKLDIPIKLEGKTFNEAVIAPKHAEDKIAEQEDVVCHFFIAPQELDTSSNSLTKNDFDFIDWVKVNPNAIE